MEKTHSFVRLLAESHPYLLIAAAILLGLAIGVMLGILLGYRVMLRPVQRRYQAELGVANEEIIRTKTEFSEYKRRVRRKLEREIARIKAQEVQLAARNNAGQVVGGGSADPEYDQRVQDYFQTTSRLFSEMQEAQQAMFEQMQRVNHRYTQVIEHVNLGAATLTGRLPAAETPADDASETRRPRRRVREDSTTTREARIRAAAPEPAPPEQTRGVVSDFMADLQRADRPTVEHEPDDRSTRRKNKDRAARRPRRGSLS